MLILVLLWAIVLVCLGFSIFFYMRYKTTRRKTYFVFSLLLIGLFLMLIQVAIKYVIPV